MLVHHAPIIPSQIHLLRNEKRQHPPKRSTETDKYEPTDEKPDGVIQSAQTSHSTAKPSESTVNREVWFLLHAYNHKHGLTRPTDCLNLIGNRSKGNRLEPSPFLIALPVAKSHLVLKLLFCIDRTKTTTVHGVNTQSKR